MTSNFKKATKKKPCAICLHGDWCLESPDGEIAICWRVSAGSVKETPKGGNIHVLIERDKSELRPRPKAEKKVVKNTFDIDKHKDKMFRWFLGRLSLAENHKQELLSRGLNQTDLLFQSYLSMPTKKYADAICKLLSEFHSFEGIPGFYFENDRWQFKTSNVEAFIIPIRNEFHQIVALQARTNKGQTWNIGGETIDVPKYLLISSGTKPKGTASGAPPHFATLGKPFLREKIHEIIITEGALKANIIQKFVDVPVIGLVSVTCFDETLPERLHKIYPNLKKVKIAFDQEIFDPKRSTSCAFVHVNKQKERLIKVFRDFDLIEKKSTEIVTLSWHNSFKGFDDFLTREIKIAA